MESNDCRDKQPQPAADGPRYQAEFIQRWLVAKLAELLEIEPSAIDIQAPFASYGLESVDLVGLSGELEEWLKRELSPTLLYDYSYSCRWLPREHRRL